MVLSLSLLPVWGQAASFDCQKARLSTEKQICAVRSLNDADVKLATTYRIVLKAVPMGTRGAEQETQVQWLQQRNRCGSNSACIAKMYQNRQVHLDNIIQCRVLSQGAF
ncbi:hypothetical protein GWI33_009987 [Rhynchophorus ferrugineus]|uniref:Lysozyme inhibitor LprI N-terminal domain-containing protein n=1 Tax=Rhynchophorus ferrugineus TaxID=354439 RepID=A0A834M9E4_RHYFE|nr:hypothetical protein GWI33_009987 [Rhynchophorus ferrugineus]